MINKVTLYGSNISYFTGKMENYFRVRRIPYEFKNMQFPAFEKEMEKNVGVMQMPAVVLSDGRWMTDTTKMIQWFENEINDNKIIEMIRKIIENIDRGFRIDIRIRMHTRAFWFILIVMV